MELSKKQVDNYYVSRMIDSLENDYDKWKITHCGGGPGMFWTEYHGPEYENSEKNRISFAYTLNSTGAYINGRIRWTVPIRITANPFSYQGRRLRKAYKKMKAHLEIKEEKERLNNLMNSL
jgi:hypothetical protein